MYIYISHISLSFISVQNLNSLKLDFYPNQLSYPFHNPLIYFHLVNLELPYSHLYKVLFKFDNYLLMMVNVKL